MLQDTIVALATARGLGTLAIIRASGSNLFDVIHHFIFCKKYPSILEIPSGKIFLAEIHDSSKKESSSLIDIVTIILYRAPKSFTGENCIEIICHNNEIIITSILNLFLKFGAKIARGGEFSKRAFLNKKLDLTQAEAIHEIIFAQNEQALARSMQQLQGSLSAHISKLSQRLLSIIYHLEAFFEFQEEDVLDIAIDKDIENNVNELIKQTTILYNSIELQKTVRSGAKIVLIGNTNAGKSTLFNTILQKDRAIVSDIAGTTRDIVEGSINNKKGKNLILLDTAGIRESKDEIERLGIEKTLQEIGFADLVLFLVDGSKESFIDEEVIANKIFQKTSNVLLVINKIDINLTKSAEIFRKKFQDSLIISCKTGKNIEELEKYIDKKLDYIFNSKNSPFLLSKYQIFLITEFYHNLKKIEDSIKNNTPPEILVIELKTLLLELEGISGKSLQEDVLEKIFSNFCIGK